ncbi:MAG: hypothetical protein IPK37_16115 [Austwickia sp.]|jgi:hypothetical protein|nr:MAG: hypothetical protein IPK37_16115 [Austwickia sp.]
MRLIADRTRPLPAPPPVVWADLAEPRAEGTRAWLRLLPDEVPPRVLSSYAPRTLVWSSLWIRHPALVVRLDCRPDGPATRLRVCIEAPDDLALSDAAVGHVRHRINHLLFADLRATYGQ